LDTPSYA